MSVSTGHLPISGLRNLRNHSAPALVVACQVIAAVLIALSPFSTAHWWRLSGEASPAIENLLSFGIPYVVGVIYLLSSLYVFALRARDPAARVFAFSTAAASVLLSGWYDAFTAQSLIVPWVVALALAGGGLLHLGLVFPVEFPWSARYPYLRWIGYLPGMLLLAWASWSFSLPMRPNIAARFLSIEFLFLGFVLIFVFGANLFRSLTASAPDVRERARLMVGGITVSFGPLALGFALRLQGSGPRLNSYWLLPTWVFPIMAGYALFRYRLISTDKLFNQGTLYGLMSVLAAGGYALLVSGLSLLFGDALNPTHPLVVGLMVFLLASLLNPLRDRLQAAIDSVFFRTQVVYQHQLQKFSRELTQAMGLADITQLLRRYAFQAVQPSRLHIFIHDLLSEDYVATTDASGKPSSDIRFPAPSALAQTLSRRRNSIFLDESGTFPTSIQPDRARLVLLGSQLLVPLPGQQSLTGWLALGRRRSGAPYTHQDLNYLESLCAAAALAVARAQVVTNLERRIREMNVLTRVAQGVNFTIAFDDILELIFAQTCQVIPVRDFWVTLVDASSGSLSYAFCLENNERLSDRENHPLPEGYGLEGICIRGRRALYVNDYERECRDLGVLPGAQPLYAWMGVPLNSGSETVGLISLGTRDSGVAFSEEQLNLLQAIADQTAGAMVKARLFAETERRARQLATLNEIGNSLTSTLELKPLLNRILQSATEILNCEAGSLFLLDEHTRELVFEVVIGPVASDLIGRRLPVGTGLVGEAVTTGKSILANSVKHRDQWFDQTDHQTGFDTQNLLVAPMQVKDRVIGVIEVINKADGQPFHEADQNLLMTFSSQASIAIENARLYTLTDQALAARVEELSIMQRIDRELNDSLDLGRAMRITLDWAIRQSDMEAGLATVITDGKACLVASQGYSDEFLLSISGTGETIETGQPLHLPVIRFPGLFDVLQTGQLHVDRAEGRPPGSFGLLEGAQSQVFIPIHREAGVMGILLLESRKPGPPAGDTLAFLSRLCDHAAIAIANAQLYAEVKSANQAKSKFVSFVAHELKNPMAAIKGYAELVAGGMAGPVNEMQSSFLATVRSNVDRMNTIVSDLNDLTKIQMGSLRLDVTPVPVQEILEDAIRSIRRQLDEKSLELVIQAPPDLPLAWADSLRLGQILTNLLSNAQKYTPSYGRITVGVEADRSGDESVTRLDVLHFWIEDTGIGIAPTDQGKIFQQYYRTEASKELASGTGLGLNITRSLVEMQGGSIWFQSVLGKGTTFHFTVPVAEAV